MPYDPAVLLLGIYLKGLKTDPNTCLSVFTEALFIIAKTRKQVSINR